MKREEERRNEKQREEKKEKKREETMKEMKKETRSHRQKGWDERKPTSAEMYMSPMCRPWSATMLTTVWSSRDSRLCR